MLQDQVSKLVLALLKGGKESKSREGALEWVARAIELNAGHRMEQPKIATLSSSSLMVNLGAVMLKLCEPFLDPTSAKKYGVGLIDEQFLRSNTGILPTEGGEMLVQAGAEEGTLTAELLPPPHLRKSHQSFNFVTRCFFLTLRCLSLGVVKIISTDYPTFMYSLHRYSV
jgi:ubiquitin conjugation factor E4 B